MDLDEYYSYEILTEEFFELFEKDFGKIKFEGIKKDINNSTAVKNLIADCLKYEELPNSGTLATVLLGTRNFMFSKSIVIACASFLALDKVIQAFYKNGNPVTQTYALNMAKSIIRVYRKI